MHGVDTRGRRSERTQVLSSFVSMIPPRVFSEPKRLDGASPLTRRGRMEHVVGVDVSKARLDAYDLAGDCRLAVANDAAGIARLAA